MTRRALFSSKQGGDSDDSNKPKTPEKEEEVVEVEPTDETNNNRSARRSLRDDIKEQIKIVDVVVEATNTPKAGGETEGETESSLVVPNQFWPEELLILPLTERPPIPGTPILMPVHVKDPSLMLVIQGCYERGDRFLGAFLVHEEHRKAKLSTISQDQLHGIGVICRITDLKVDPSGQGIVHLFALKRIRVERAIPNRPALTIRTHLMKDITPLPERQNHIKAYTNEILKTWNDLIKNGPLNHEYLMHLKHSVADNNPGRIADFAAASTSASGNELQEVLECIDVDERMSKSLFLLKKELELSNFQRRVARQVEDKINAQQRTMMLQEQLKMIKKELGLETDEKEQLVQKFNERMAECKPPAHAQKVIDEEMRKMSSLDSNSSEFNVARNYLEWLTSLPWNKTSQDSYDLEHAARVLDEDHYGLDDLKTRIKEFIAVGKLVGNINGKIICLVGPPGVGKTSIGKSVARALGREFYRFSVGGLSDVAEIKGHRRTYIGAMPGKLIQCMKSVQTSNPVIMIDEIDKLSKGHSGDPASALLEVLDPSQNTHFNDHYLDVPYDLSKVLFLCTANVLETIPKPLLDRMEVMRLSGYVLEEKVAIASQYLVPAALKESGLHKAQAQITEDSLVHLIKWYCREAGVRNLKQHIEKLMRQIALAVATKQRTKAIVTPKDLLGMLGQAVFQSDRLYDTTPAGVVTGLAWTSMGGATLYIESVGLATKHGKASLQTTGQMGSVMKESSAVCYTFARSFLANLDPDNQFFDNTEIHLHIPEGATPKDGPSAGVTMVTSMLSLALKRPPAPVAMTGEITLTGRVLRIGGVREKIIAAKRSGMYEVILPAENQRDFDELPEYIRQGVVVHFASTYQQVFDVALGPHRPTTVNV
eukprot:c20423_g1_i3.p1 GENE.c20423_g1_i3~~c20423_g1_i3.p1  ORF type:complete len:928 (+),score=214.71 c20423_g1_i3:143-2785(+)